ncbi:MAG TPA: efflux RND transporter periplasmic adaptor subunit [Puia sp.]|nr:efflux RND transporter periplasmic adaptor subunit [Puia sp.]
MKAFNLLIIGTLLMACNDRGGQEISRKQDSTEKQEGAKPAEPNKVRLTEAQMKNAGIETGHLEKKNISSILKLNGAIDVPPQNMVSVSVPLGGYLKSTRLLPGMHIGKGETIAVMEDQQYIQWQQDYLTAKAKLTYAEQEFNRQRDLNQSKASSDKVYQQAQMDFTSQKILVKSLGEKLQLIGIRPDRLDENNLSRTISIPSPIEGFVTKVNVNIGKYVNPSDVLFEIVNPSDIHLALTVFEKDVNKLSVGQQLVAYTNNNPGKKYTCEIILIGKDFSNDKAVEVHCHFKTYDKALIPGMFMNAEVRVEGQQVDALPVEAIVSYQGKEFVFVVTGDKQFEMKEAKTGTAENGYTAIDTGNTGGLDKALIVTKGAYTLLMKMKNTGEDE